MAGSSANTSGADCHGDGSSSVAVRLARGSSKSSVDSWKDLVASPHESDEKVELRRGGEQLGLLAASLSEAKRPESGRRNGVDSSPVRVRRAPFGEICGRGDGDATASASAMAMGGGRRGMEGTMEL